MLWFFFSKLRIANRILVLLNPYHVLSFLYYRGVAIVGELVSFEACMDLMDLLYEKEETSILYRSPRSLATAILAWSQTLVIWIYKTLFYVLFLRYLFRLLHMSSQYLYRDGSFLFFTGVSLYLLLNIFSVNDCIESF